MDIPFIRGKVALQAHVGLPQGTVEEEYARDGFFGRYAHLYRREPPVGWTRIVGPLRPRAFDLGKLPVAVDDWLANRHPLLVNDDVRISSARLAFPMPYVFRNADADEVLFIHEGAGRFESDFGSLAYRPGDYLVVPRGTAYRLVPSFSSWVLLTEAFSEVTFPEKGMLGQHALFDPAVVRVPSPEEPATLKPGPGGEYELRILRTGELPTSVFYPFSPLNTVGWKGTLSVLQLNVEDIRPVVSERYHLPPSAHSTFVMRNAVMCSFLPRPLENGDPQALKVPFFHSNIDFDEVIFYHRGQFFSRTGIGPGLVTLHPQGIHHGPQPGAAERSRSLTHTDEVAVMIDTRNPLRVVESTAASAEIEGYLNSWKSKER